jgi:hypothetical protein
MRKRTKEDFIKRAIEVHGNKFDYSLVEYVRSIINVSIKCNRCNSIFSQRPANHLMGRGCTNCAIKSSSLKRSSNIEEFIEKAISVHGFQYEYDETTYITAKLKIKIKCKIHGEFLQTPGQHLSGRGCPECGDIKMGEAHKSSLGYFLNKSKETHGDVYDYSSIDFRGDHIKVDIVCKIHGIFSQMPYAHTRGSGCPQCAAHAYNSSNLEKEWLDFISLSEEKRQASIRINGKLFKLDGFDPDTNTIYEFYGDYWHGNPKVFDENDINPSNYKPYKTLYQETFNREESLKEAGYKIISIWESDWKKISNSK